jgi:ribonuclease Z
MAELLILGSSAGIPTKLRNNTGLAIKTSGKLYLFDCGCPVPGLLRKMGEDTGMIESLFITHWHTDHTTCLPILIQDLQLTRRRKDFPIFGPAGTRSKIKELQKIFLLPQEFLPFELPIHEYSEGLVFEDEYISVSAFATGHLDTEKWKKIDEQYHNEIKPFAFGFVIHCEGKKIVISGDMRHSDDIRHVIDNADLVVHEFGHFLPEAVNKFIKEVQINRLLLTHIRHDWDDREEELRALISAGHTGTVQIAHDLMRLEV